MGTGYLSFTREELDRLKSLCRASQKHGVNWVRAVSTFPAETKEEMDWKARMLAGISLVEAIIFRQAQTGE